MIRFLIENQMVVNMLFGQLRIDILISNASPMSHGNALIPCLRVKHHQLLAGLEAAGAAAAAQLVIQQEDGGGDNAENYNDTTRSSNGSSSNISIRVATAHYMGNIQKTYHCHVDGGEHHVVAGEFLAEPYPHILRSTSGLHFSKGKECEGRQQYQIRVLEQYLH